MDSLKYNTNLNIGIEMYKKFILIIMEKYRTQSRIIFLPFLLHVQPSTKVCLSKDRICGGSHECIMYTEFPKFTDNSLSCTVEPMFNTSNSENHCYNDRAK